MAYLAYGGDRRPATVFTVHNLAYQGQFPADLLDRLRLPAQAWGIDGVEHYGAIGFLKAGLQFADRITTVSPTYARDIQTAAGGCGLEGLLRARARRVVRHLQRDRRGRLESGDRQPDRFAFQPLVVARTFARTRRSCNGGSPWGRIRSGCCSAS